VLPARVLFLAAALAPLVQEAAPGAVPPLRTPFGLPEREAGADDAEGVARLGARLFFDPVLSVDRTIACASCHRPERAFADDVALSAGVAGKRTARNTPTLLNRAFGASFLWDGRAPTLEQQALLPIENPLEMNLPLEEALARLDGDPEYRRAFEATLGGAPDEARLGRALAAYVRRLVTGDSPIDRFRAGDFAALSDAERAGLWFYESRGGCWRCHSGPNFTDEEFHNTGVGAGTAAPDPGRGAITAEAADHGRFKTPTLRGVAHTAPYMHDGSLATLEEVVEFYRQGGHANDNLDPLVRAIDMSAEDAANLVAFLKALSVEGERPGDEGAEEGR